MTTSFESGEAGLLDHLGVVERVRELLPELAKVADRLIEVYESDGRLFTFGNGGSAADAQHLAAELIGRYKRTRRPLPAVALTVDPSVLTCIANDYGYDDVFARQVVGFVRPGDMVIAFSTSGRSANVVRGLDAARRQGATTVYFGGSGGGTGAGATERTPSGLTSARGRVGVEHGRREDGVSVESRERPFDASAAHADHALVVDSTETARIQEMHLLLLHLLSERVDAWAAGET